MLLNDAERKAQDRQNNNNQTDQINNATHWNSPFINFM